MTREQIVTLLDRIQSWPEEAQEELAQVAREIEADLAEGRYRATSAELEGIDRGLRDVEAGRIATPGEVEGVFAKYRRA
jgi:predicted transcriptional regulator